MEAWDTALGSSQGRIQPSGWTPPNGSYAFVLGHDLKGQWTKLSPGDFDAISQTADFTGVSFLRWRAHLRPGATPAGVWWDFVVFVDGDEHLRRRISREHDRNDFAIPIGAICATSGITDHQVQFQVELVGASGIYDVELPAVYLDALVLDASTVSPVLINRDPEPGDTGVDPVVRVRFELASAGATPVDITKVDADLFGAPSVSAGVLRPAFSGSVAVSPDGMGVSVDYTINGSASSLDVVDSRVVYPGFDQTYSFTIADFDGPSVVSALGLEDRLVRVTFDEPIVGNGSYVITLISGVPAVTPVVVAATAETSTTVLLTLNTEQTPGATYEVTVTGVADLFGNDIGTGTAQWTGYACAGVVGRSFDLYSMMLRSDRAADETGDLRNFIGCFQETTNLLLCKIDRFIEILDPDTASEVYLDRMLSDLGNPFPFDLEIIDKRRLVQLLVAIYRSKGTDAGIINAIRFFLGIEVTITVPWQTTGLLGASTIGGTFVLGTGDLATIYSFIINSPVVLTDEQRRRITLIARYMKRAPTHFTIVEPTAPPSTPNHWALGASKLGLNTLLH